MPALPRVFRATLLSLTFLAAYAPVHAQSLIWRNDWTVQAPPTFLYYYFGSNYLLPPYQQQEPFAFSPDGEVLMRTPTLVGQDDQIARFTSSGAVRWRVNLGSVGSMEEIGYSAMVGYQDGSAIVAAQGGVNVIKIGADGALKWASMQDVYALALLANNAVAVLGCNTLSALDVQSGQVLWKHTFPKFLGGCVTAGVTSDAVGNSYATLSTFSDENAVNGFQLLKFDPNGNVLWQKNAAAPSTGVPSGVDGSRVYVTSSDSLRAFSANDGAAAWSAPGAHLLCMAGVPAEPIVSSANGVERLAGADGQPRWSQPAAGATFASASGNRIIVGTTALDATSGAVLWSASLPSADQYGNGIGYVSSGFLSDGTVLFSGRTFGPSAQPLLQRVDPMSGQLLNAFTITPVTQSFLATSILTDAQTIAGVGTLPTLSGTELHVRGLEADTGALRWETIEHFDIHAGYPSWTGLTGAGSAISVTVTEPNAVWVGAFDRLSGSKRWSTLLSNMTTGQGRTYAYDPISDPSGNIFISYGTTIYCPPAFNYVCSQLSVVKLNAVDGSIAWQHDEVFATTGYEMYPDTIVVSGSDLLLAGEFTGQNAAASLLKLSGVDGSVVWSSNIFYSPNIVNGSVQGIYPVADGNIVVTGGGWAKLDGKTGATIWSNPPDYTCTGVCYGYAVVTLSDGALLFAGEDNRRTWISLLPAAAGAASINWHPDLNDSNITSSFATDAYPDSTGAVWMRVVRHYGTPEISYLAKFDMATGAFGSQQAQASHVFSKDSLVPWVSPIMLAAPENNRLPAVTYINNPPAPFVSGNALVDSTITANGNLSIQIIMDHTYVRVGDLLSFHLIANYSGDAPISGTRLVADFPWTGFATGLSCATQSASNCQLDTRASSVVANFDIQPGGHVDINGSIRVTSTSSVARLRALVAGPIGLNELDANDNAYSAVVDQSLFADGFE